VVSGNRQGELGAAALACCDCVVQTAPIDQCLAAAHEVHTLTSLVGFEALLRQLPVVTYGQPFYAGWGLTEDRQPVARRTRRLSIDELVAGVLIRYPRYYSLKARAFVTPEDILTELELERARRGASIPVRAPRAVRQLRRLWSFARELSRAS
jgi:capsular polysaccharide export protein